MENPFRQGLFAPDKGKRQREAAQKARDENREKTELTLKRLGLYPQTDEDKRDKIEDCVFCLLEVAVEAIHFNKQTERKKSAPKPETVVQLSIFYSKTATRRVQTILDNEGREAALSQQALLWAEFKTQAQQLVRIEAEFSHPPKHQIVSIQEHLKVVMSDFINNSRKATEVHTS